MNRVYMCVFAGVHQYVTRSISIGHFSPLGQLCIASPGGEVHLIMTRGPLFEYSPYKLSTFFSFIISFTLRVRHMYGPRSKRINDG